MKEGIFEYKTSNDIEIRRRTTFVNGDVTKDNIVKSLNSVKGAYYSSSFEYPGRYARWDIGFINPPVEIRAFAKRVEILMLNKRGEPIIEALAESLRNADFIDSFDMTHGHLKMTVKDTDEVFSEENRSKKPTVFSLLRAVISDFASQEDEFLGLYGAFGFDLIHQFEEIEYRMKRDENHPDLVLYIPDSIFVRDNKLKQAFTVDYEFTYRNVTSIGLDKEPIVRHSNKPAVSDVNMEYQKGKYAAKVRETMDSFRRGDLFEVVPSQVLYRKCDAVPSEVFERLTMVNPSPYGFFINLGDEYLIGASPEMYVRVEKKRIETCPISGTIKRGRNAIEDSLRINEILNSKKDESELTMCTDVDRNDKSRICVPGSVSVIGRRQIEMYSHLIHTVDHVEGVLRDDLDSLDGFMSHMWAVTVTGAPKRAAIKWIEENEETPREWYGGAIGFLRFNGSINTGLTLRTIALRDSVARVRVGATVLFDSIPEAEEEETLTKAAAMMKVLEGDFSKAVPSESASADKNASRAGAGKRVLFVDHEDSFVNTLADYFRKAGAEVETYRYREAQKMIERSGRDYDLVVLSPGPGTPDDFKLSVTIDLCLRNGLPIFGVCLGLQGLAEYFGGRLGQLDIPVHGKQSVLTVAKEDSRLYGNMAREFNIGRYHSLYASELPECLEATSHSEDGVIMSIEHRTLPITAVQFHPESIMTMENDNGYNIILNVLQNNTKSK